MTAGAYPEICEYVCDCGLSDEGLVGTDYKIREAGNSGEVRGDSTNRNQEEEEDGGDEEPERDEDAPKCGIN
ncbi:unnamed protein product [Acanthoscelides obtectus]|uniref:Uncharacterized protein n=1 Tax=Acanthoscelides obtectus TaxID=200917 RepID=A0A9P0P320_ACAOB|nr:unnamed protein product [Acanthoscelides obtectus]CAK1622891.1 hypothetical protein AOBTE_LOCUS1713 [Acanthoscelides obtectus]